MCKSKKSNKTRSGIALVLAMIFLAVFSTLAAVTISQSSKNVAISGNHRQANRAFNNAHSGLEVIRYQLAGLVIEGSADATTRFNAVAAPLVANMGATYDGTTLIIADTSIASENGEVFTATLTQPTESSIQLNITGKSGNAKRLISSNFDFDQIGNSVFDFGVATKGPLSMTGQAGIDGVDQANIAIEASVYIEGVAGETSLNMIGQASIAGDVSIAKDFDDYNLGTKSSVGGVTGDEALEHVHTGTDPVSFPEPNPAHFLPYATGDVITDNSYDNHETLNNVIIKAGTNPNFASNVTINGVLYIESPNNVHFSGKVVINGVIVGDGELDNIDSSMKFSGQVISNDVSVLPEGGEFDAIRSETGTFLMAPGFDLEFAGQANHVNGAIAGSGISFTGQAGGVINGSILNYSENIMSLAGQSELLFNRSGIDSLPAGFEPDSILTFSADSYAEGY